MIALSARSGAALLALVLTSCGSTERSPSIEAKLRRHLADRSLSAHWVRCVPGSAAVYRCNVDFGDPHVQIYCAAVIHGLLRAAEWRQPVRGREDRAASARECARRLRTSR